MLIHVRKLWMAGLLAIAVVSPGAVKPVAGRRLPLYEKRATPEDLMLSGQLLGLPPNTMRYVSYSDLLKLPQVSFEVTDDPNFTGKTEIGGVYLDEVLRALHISEKNTMVAAICDDKYEAHYPVAYRAAHHPILVLRINGQQPAQWPRTSDGGSYGPYLISHASFTPKIRALSYVEESQIPNGVLELRFSKENEVLHAIHPHGSFAAGSPEMLGYTIAQGNCFRCHNSGAYGGNKSGQAWSALAQFAKASPEVFARYVKDPHSINASAQMPGFPEYDDATLSALTTYFKTFADGASQ